MRPWMLYFQVGRTSATIENVGPRPMVAMAQASAESQKRAWLKAGEVCELAQVQPYVLRTWELEFPDLGVTKTPGGPRVYRRADVDRVLRIKQLVFGDGLTLAGARRKIEEERASASDELPFDDEPAPAGKKLPADARRRIVRVRDELRSLLALLSRPRGNGHVEPATAPRAAASKTVVSSKTVASAAAARAGGGRKTVAKRARR
jgi:DNA-binding transcriptional MerR regulator